MKTQMKRVSRKAISAIVALAIVLSCVAVSFSVFAAGSTYKVSSAAPSIPMYVDKAINLQSLEIEIAGTYKKGSDLDWNNSTRLGVSAQVSGNLLIGTVTGNTRFTVSDGVNTQNVWVFVNAKGNNDFTLLNSEFSDPNTYNLNDWIGSAAGLNEAGSVYANGSYQLWTGGCQPTIVSPVWYYNDDGSKHETSRECFKVGCPGSQYATFATFYKSEVLKDYSDYTVNAKIGSVIVNAASDDTKANCLTAASGIMVRASLSDAAWNSTPTNIPSAGAVALSSSARTLHLRFRNYGGVMLSAYKANEKAANMTYLYGDQANMYYTGSINPADLWVGGDKNKVVLPSEQAGTAFEYIKDINVQLQGTGIKYTLNGNTIFDTIANNDVKGMYTPINEAGKTGNTADSTEYGNKIFYNQPFPSNYTTVNTISHSDYEQYYRDNLQAEKGTFAITNGWGTITHVYSVKVNVGGIDLNNMPEMSDIAVAKVFSVPSSSPAIPLYVNKGIDLSLLDIAIGKSSITGDKLTWNRISGTAAKLQDGKLVGVSAGIAGFTVTDDTNTQNVWVIVNETGDDDFALVNFDFANGDTFNANDWVTGQLELTKDTYASVNNMQGLGAPPSVLDSGHFVASTNVSASQAQAIASMATPTVKTQSGTKTQSALYLRSTNNTYGSTAAFYKSEMMKDFANYTISADISVKMEGADTQHQLAAPGIFARASINNNAKAGELILNPDKKSYLFRFRNYGGIGVFAVTGSNKIVGGNKWETTYLSMSPGTCYFTKGALLTKESQLYPGADLDKKYVMYPNAKSDTALSMRNVKIELNNRDIKYTLDGNVIFDIASKKPLSRTALSFKLEDDPFKIETATSDLLYTKYDSLWDQNMNAHSGTIGLANNFGEGLYVYSLRADAKNILEAENMPTYEDVDIEEALYAPVNTRMNLDQIKAGSTWVDAETDQYEVKNGILSVFDIPPKSIITVKNTKGESFKIEATDAGESTDYEVTTFAPNQIFVEPQGDGTYRAYLDEEYDIELDSLKVTNAFGDNEEIILQDAVEDGVVYEFEADMSVANIEVKFISEVEAVQQVKILGATIKTDKGSEAIRFRTRVPAIRDLELYADAFRKDGVDVEFQNVGVLVIPKVLLGSSALRIDTTISANADFDAAESERILIRDKAVAKNVPIVTLKESNQKYSDAWVALTYASAATEDIINKYDVDIATVAYLQYKDASGNIGYIYSDEVVRNYNQIDALSKPV